MQTPRRRAAQLQSAVGLGLRAQRARATERLRVPTAMITKASSVEWRSACTPGASTTTSAQGCATMSCLSMLVQSVPLLRGACDRARAREP
eukprot:2255293-Prymnesium_polylepis.1